MNDCISNRIIELGNYIAENACTVRAAAKKFGMGKSTVHKYVAEQLADLDPSLYEKVRRILDYNLSVRHIRGGEATKRKCADRKRNSQRE